MTGTRRLLLAGALVTVVGIAVAATSPIVGLGAADRIHAQQSVGGVLVLAGWTLLGWALHRFGREA